MDKSTREMGSRYETEAAVYLQQMGYQILEYNFRCRTGEIDLIARDGEYLCFVEVKYRESGTCGDPFGAVDKKKQRRISRTALFYLMKKELPDTTSCRFDVVGITPDEIKVLKNAFSFIT